tara:strand:- start:151 stop:972 length:822 start_codon:yes stop_codon:yes gene_type:complete
VKNAAALTPWYRSGQATPLNLGDQIMLNEQTLEKLYAMKLNGLAEAWLEQQQHPHSSDLSFDERLGMLAERQWLWKENRALVTRLKFAQLRQSACLEDIDYRHPRALKRAVVEQLAACDWIRHHRHCIITGPTGVGKSYLACAFAHKACREQFRALYFYAPKFFRALNLAQADGSLTRLLRKLARVDLLVIDDWGMSPLKPDQYRLFLEILDDRQGTGANLITSQYKVKDWHQLIGDPTVGDAILDRLVHSAHKLELDGDSMRGKKTAKKAQH